MRIEKVKYEILGLNGILYIYVTYLIDENKEEAIVLIEEQELK